MKKYNNNILYIFSNIDTLKTQMDDFDNSKEKSAFDNIQRASILINKYIANSDSESENESSINFSEFNDNDNDNDNKSIKSISILYEDQKKQK